ncbi:tyrosine phosphatase-like protein [Aspergillus granulosus]|uniref:Very-long-chain (3R)-3-hydroxyacyl-CoA dehydratase n=1 Tax=Aspergillus granulosus TaxID=176169 RepID=A0ABR4GWR9_9EURO
MFAATQFSSSLRQKSNSTSMAASKVYLLFYNSVSALLWLRVLLAIVTSYSDPEIFTTVEPWTRWTQTLAVIEILHAATGITRAPVFTTFTQIFARSVQVWAINYSFPEVTASSPAYLAMLAAWSTADVVRYLYFAVLLTGAPVPRALKWLRYSLFLALYPIGIGSEWWLMYRATTVTTNLLVAGIFYFFLGLYAPGSVMMYRYMVKQRRKTLSN